MSAVSNLGKYIRARRDTLGVTGRDLAAEIGIEASLLSRLETGIMKTFPEPELVQRLAERMAIPMADLLVAAGYLSEDDLTIDDSPIVREFTGLLRQMRWTPEREHFVRTMLMQMIAFDQQP